MTPLAAILDTGAGPNFVHDAILPVDWRDYEIPQGRVGPFRSATSNPHKIRGEVSLYIQIGTYRVRTRFTVTANLSVPCIVGCEFIDRHMEAIHLREQKVVLTYKGG